MKKLYCIISLICFILMMTACSTGNKNAGGEPPALSHFEPVTDIKEGRSNIYLIIKVVDSGYWQVIVNGAMDAGNALDCNIYCGGTTIETDWQGQRVLINEALENNADAIIIAPDDSVELATDIDRIHDSGIPVVLVDTAANTNSFDICYMTDNLLAGQNAADEMLKQLKNTGHSEDEEVAVGIMVGSATSQTINERLAGFYKFWSENAPEKWAVISDIMNCNGNIDLGDKLTYDFLKRYPKVCGLYGTNNGPTRALCQVLKAENRTDIIVVGFDFSDEIRELIESPDYIASTMLQRQYDMSYNAVVSSLDLLNGVTPEIKFEDTGVVTVNKDTLSDPTVVKVLEHN